MDKISLSASARSSDLTAKAIRQTGHVPCVVYGNTENVTLQVELLALTKAYTKAGESTLVEIDAGEKKIPVLFHAVDFDPLTDRITHVDFYAVNLKKEVEANVHLKFEGEAPAVKSLGGVLVITMHEVTVKALPANLPHDLTVDLSTLSEFGNSITVAEINVPEGVTILDDAEELVALVQEPRAEEVVAAPTTPAEGAATDGTAAPAEGEEKKEEEKKS